MVDVSVSCTSCHQFSTNKTPCWQQFAVQTVPYYLKFNSNIPVWICPEKEQHRGKAQSTKVAKEASCYNGYHYNFPFFPPHHQSSMSPFHSFCQWPHSKTLEPHILLLQYWQECKLCHTSLQALAFSEHITSPQAAQKIKCPTLKLVYEIEHFLSALLAADIQTCPVPSKGMNPVLFLCSQSTKIQDIQWCLNISNRSSFTCHKRLKQDLPDRFSNNHTAE